MIPLRTQLSAKFDMHLGQVVGTKSDHELKPFYKLKHELSSYNNLLPGISNLSFLVHFCP